MAKPYSVDLRKRAVDAVQQGKLTQVEVAAQFQVSTRTLHNWLKRLEEASTLAPKPHGGGARPSVDEAGAQRLSRLVAEQNDRTLEEYADLYEQECGVRLSRSVLSRALIALKLARKKRRSGPASRTATM
jgi:transposase